MYLSISNYPMFMYIIGISPIRLTHSKCSLATLFQLITFSSIHLHTLYPSWTQFTTHSVFPYTCESEITHIPTHVCTLLHTHTPHPLQFHIEHHSSSLTLALTALLSSSWWECRCSCKVWECVCVWVPIQCFISRRLAPAQIGSVSAAL